MSTNPPISRYGPSIVVLVTMAALLVIGPVAVRQLTWHQTDSRIRQASERLSANNVLHELNEASRDLATFVEPSVVHVSTEREIVDQWNRAQLLSSSGSGWVYDDLGHIVTNFHVVQDAQRLQVQMHDGEIHTAEIIGFDQFTDIAVIRVATAILHPAVRAGERDVVRQGDLVFAFGSPFDFRFSMSSGIVSGIGRYVGVIRDDLDRWQGYENFIQVDAAINPGNSGGPLTDIQGRVIGMNTAIATGSTRSSFEEGQFAGIGLAIPIDMIEPVVRQIIDNRVVQKGFLGVGVDNIGPRVSQQLQRTSFRGQGVIVIRVDRPGPADSAGLQVQDIITRVNHQEVASVPQLRSVISSMLPGDEASLSVWRWDPVQNIGTSLEIEVELARYDIRRLAGVLPADQRRDQLELFGIAQMRTSSDAIATAYGTNFIPGVVVDEIVEGSQIDGIVPPGSVMVAVRDDPVASIDELFEQLNEINLRTGEQVRVTFILPSGRRSNPVLIMP